MFQSLKDQINGLVTSLPTHKTTLTEVILILLEEAFSETDLDHSDAARNLSKKNSDNILNFMYARNGEMRKSVIQWANQVTTSALQTKMSHLASKETGFHFLAKKITESKLKDFNIEEMAINMQHVGPAVWQLLSKLLEADPRMNYKRNWARKKAEASGKTHQKASHIRHDKDIEMEDITLVKSQDSEYWDTYDCEEIPLVADNDDEPEGLSDQLQDQFQKLKTIICVLSVITMIKSEIFIKSRSYVSV